MLENLKNIVKPSGLDTLSERSLRRLTDRWTGELHEVDTLLDARSATQVTSEDTFSAIVGQWRKAREIYHESSVEEIFGDGASFADGVLPVGSGADSLAMSHRAAAPVEEMFLSASEPATSIGEWMPLLYNVMIVLVLLYYIYCHYRYFDDIIALFRSIFERQVVPHGRSEERRRSDIFYGALGKLFMMGLMFVGVLSSLAVRRMDGVLSSEQLFYLPFAVIGVFVLVVCVQYAMLAMMGFVTHSLGEVAALMRIRLIHFVLATVLVAPVMLVAQMNLDNNHVVWQNIGFVAAFLVFIMFVRESISFFISKKVSILHWILYLCTVEILPFTLLWQGVVRLT